METPPTPSPEAPAKKTRKKKEPPKYRTSSRAEHRQALRRAMRYFYDLQKLRISQGNRGHDWTDRTEPDAPREPTPGQSNAIDLAPDVAQHFVHLNEQMSAVEKSALKVVEDLLMQEPFYAQRLSVDREKWRGLGVTFAAVMLAEIDIEKAENVSKLWKYAGIAPIGAWREKETFELVEILESDSNGTPLRYRLRPYKSMKPVKPGDEDKEAKAAKKRNVEPQAAKNPDGSDRLIRSGESMRPTKGQKLPYNAFLRTKLLGVFCGNVLKSGNEHFRKFYDDYKHRLVSSVPMRGRVDGHRHAMSMRYMGRMILLELWQEWRAFEKLPVRSLYAEQYLNLVHHE